MPTVTDPAAPANPAPSANSAPPSGSSTNVADEIRSLVPAEVTAVFLSLDANIRNREDENFYFYIFFGVLAIICLFYTKLVNNSPGWGKPILTSFVIFPAWALMIAYQRIDFFAARPFIATGIMLIAGLLVPILAATRAAR
jgi:hypothetical protein